MVDIQRLDHQPDFLAIHQQWPERYPYLLSSAECGGEQGRYSLLFAFPQQKIECSQENPQPFLEFLENYQLNLTPKQSELPFLGGWFFYFSYEYAQLIEQHLQLKHSELPLAFAHRVPAGFIIDHKTQSNYAFCEKEYSAFMPDLLKDSVKQQTQPLHTTLSAAMDEEHESLYLDAVKAAKKYIKDGDIFQTNLSRLWQVALTKEATAVQCFQQLLTKNPSPFSALVKINDSHTIISSSPERLVKINKGIAETRPIAGTHPRGKSEAEDVDLSSRLLKNPKEQAEHVMLIDLERNDLGRFCVPGSIKVDEFMVLESYQHVHHIVSNVIGEMAKNTTLKDVIHAVFPGGTITGCPKVRCMEIIAELEHSTRDCYTGSVGYMDHNGNGDFNILIRTMLHDGRDIKFRAGAGIVADSNPEKECEETRHKAKGMIRALG